MYSAFGGRKKERRRKEGKKEDKEKAGRKEKKTLKNSPNYITFFTLLILRRTPMFLRNEKTGVGKMA